MSWAELGALKISTAKLPEHQQPPGDLLNLQRSQNRCSGGAGDLGLVVQEMGTHLLGLLGQQASCPCTFLPCCADPKQLNTLPQRAERMWLAGEERLEKFLPWG